jgi:hypothetical protein
MAWNPSPKVADCREIARKWGNGIEQVIIIGIDGEGRTMTATYGRTPTLCACADRFGMAAVAGINRLVAMAEAHHDLAEGRKANASFTLRGEAKRNPDSGERSCSA